MQKFLLGLLFVSCSSMCLHLHAAELKQAEVINGDSATDYLFSWSTVPHNETVNIEWSYDPSFVPGTGTHIAKTNQSQAHWKAKDGKKRRYFAITTESGDTEKVAVRLLPLEGGRNFRDLGGYKTSDGRTVKWGHVFRSGTMHSLTSSDYSYLSDVGIRTICDFRDQRERDDEPTNWQAGDLDYKVFADPKERDSSENPMFATLLDPESSPEDVKLSMAAGYSDIALREKEGYTAMFKELVNGNVPLAFNCAAGKDRAGTAAALILTALGVPEQTVVHDYQLSDDYVDFTSEFLNPEKREKALAAEDHPYAFLYKLPPEKVAPLLSSDPIFIETSFADLKEKYGSVLNFIKQELNVSDEDIEKMRNALLI